MKCLKWLQQETHWVVKSNKLAWFRSDTNSFKRLSIGYFGRMAKYPIGSLLAKYSMDSSLTKYPMDIPLTKYPMEGLKLFASDHHPVITYELDLPAIRWIHCSVVYHNLLCHYSYLQYDNFFISLLISDTEIHTEIFHKGEKKKERERVGYWIKEKRRAYRTATVPKYWIDTGLGPCLPG